MTPEAAVDFNIEYSHIYYKYADKLITAEHEESIAITKQLINTLSSLGKSYCLSVMIDTSMREHCNLDEIAHLLEGRGLKPDFVINESALCDTARDLADKIPAKNRKTNATGDTFFIINLEGEEKKVELIENAKDADYVSCPLVAATWQLLRFGAIKAPEFSLEDFKAYSDKSFVGKETFTIIPKKFMRVESDVYDIISSINSFRKVKNKIKYIFY